MAMIVGIRFNQNGKIYDFDPGALQLLPGEKVMVETSRGIECGEVARANREMKEPREGIKPVLRRATPEDLERAEKNAQKAREAMKICQGRLCSATLDQVGAAALYSVDDSYFGVQREEYRRRRDTVMAKLAQIPGVICKQPEGAFYVMAALPVDDADKFQLWLLEEFEDNGDTVMFAPGEPFYATPGKGRNEIRIAYVLKQADLERAMDLLALGIEAYNKRG